MYEVIVTDDFVNLIKDIPVKNMNLITKSFMSIKKIEDVKDNTFITDLLEQIKNQELE